MSMSVARIGDQMPLAELDVGRRREARRAGAEHAPAARKELPRVVIIEGRSTHALEELLLSVASGDREALIALESRMGGLVRVNICRVLRDASRADAVTQEFFTEMLRDAIDFDPDQDSAQAWLLTRAHDRAMDGLRSGHVTVGLAAARIA